MEKEHFEILLEDRQSKFELMMEGQENLRKDLSREIREHREETQEKFDMIAYMIEGLHKKDVEFEGCFDRISRQFESMNGRLDVLSDDFAKHRASTEIHAAYTVNEEQKGHEYH